MKILITGADGFIGKNLSLYLSERKDLEISTFTRNDSPDSLNQLISDSDFVFHLAGVNRPTDPKEFETGNADLTQSLCEAILKSGRKIPVAYSSSTQAELDNPYGRSKKQAEEALFALSEKSSSPSYIYRLPNVFGKWARPNYNSAVATFCNNIARGLDIQINDPSAEITMVYIDDVVKSFASLLGDDSKSTGFLEVHPKYKITVGQLAETLKSFKESRNNLITEAVGEGLTRALYSTYVSYLPKESFSYTVPKHGDERGVFVEMLKTKDSGQFSYFTAHPGVTRGGHYHHTKTEKFLVIKGRALFKFKNLSTGEFYELETTGENPEIVETAPGWTHDITNVGSEEMTVMLWANEIFDRQNPDTYAHPLSNTSKQE